MNGHYIKRSGVVRQCCHIIFPGANGKYCIMVAHPPLPAATLPPLRCLSERVIQSLSYETGGLLVVTPLYALFFSHSISQSLSLLVALSILVLIWTPLFNALFDWAERQLSGRAASDRPHGLRIIHAATLETTAVAFTLPAVMLIGGYGLWEALLVDVGLTIAYAVYAYVFHFAFDKLRPITKGI
jgi:uncharacterized membrane protein